MPAHSAAAAARDWQLAPEGRDAARALCAHLPSGARLVASSEPKAIATLEPAGSVIPDPRFDEVSRPRTYDDSAGTQRLAYVNGTNHPGWEDRRNVVRRFQAGVEGHLDAAADQSVVIGSHGMAITLWLAESVAIDDPGSFWAGLRFPDAHVVDVAVGTVFRLLVE